MQFKNSMLLMTALTAGSAVARLHGHERRHAHPHAEPEADLEAELPVANVGAPVTTPAPAPEVEKRDGDIVHATIAGVLQSWVNNWYGEVSATSVAVSTAAPEPTAAPDPASVPNVAEYQANPPPVSSSSTNLGSGGSGGDWTNAPSDGQFSTSGFGQFNWNGEGPGVDSPGNTGIPWGSNIIRISEADASKYRNVIQFVGSSTKKLMLLFWNKIGPDGRMTGFFHPTNALTFPIAPNEVAYVAMDKESSSGWTAYEGDACPLDMWGSYAESWGEVTFRQSPNFTSWDVSVIQAQNAKLNFMGMSICQSDNTLCSTITPGASTVISAYTAALAHDNTVAPSRNNTDHYRLLVRLDYSG